MKFSSYVFLWVKCIATLQFTGTNNELTYYSTTVIHMESIEYYSVVFLLTSNGIVVNETINVNFFFS